MNSVNMKRFDMKASPLRLNVIFFGACIFWSALILVLFAWNYSRLYPETMEVARSAALESYMKDIAYRRWATMHGGVYVPITPTTPPNPYLADIPERDIRTPSGKRLTLVNPAYMTRQVHEIGEQARGIRGHITSLKPIKPENAPDNWERNALLAFEKGREEVYSVATIGDETYFRFMRPLVTESGCLKCHGAQGYKAGDIRGGISVSIKWSPFREAIQTHHFTYFFGYFVIWIVGLAGLYLGKKQIQTHLSERKRAEEALQETEHRFRELFSRMSSGVAVYRAVDDGKDFEFVDFNKAGEKIENISSDDVIGKRVTAVFPGVKEFGLLDVFRRVWQTGIPEEYPLSLYKDDRIEGWRENYVYKLPSGEIVAVYDDVTERKRIEKAVIKAKQDWERTFDTVPDLIAMLDTEYRIIRVNRPMSNRLGLTPEECVGKVCYNAIHGMTEPPVFCPHRRLLEDGREHTVEVQEDRLGGTCIVSVSPLHDQKGNLVGSIHIARDITERKRAEESLQHSYALLKSVVESSKDVVIFALDEQYRYIAFNENHAFTMKRIWGVDIASGVSMLEYIRNPADCMKAKTNFDRALAGESFTLIEEYGDTALERRFYEDIYSPIIDRNGKAIGLTLFLTDITERKQVEEERDKVIIELRQALSEIRTLSGLLPICASCKKIRNDEGYWEQIETYIRDRSEAEFSHGICPECAKKLYPDIFKE